MKTRIKFLLASGGATAIQLLWTSAALAAATINLRPGGSVTNVQNITGPGLVSAAIRLLLLVAFVIAFLFLLIGGIRWILAGGDKAAAESARGTLTAAIVGLIIVLVAWAIMWFIEQVFGIAIVSGPLTIPNAY